jgi:hypothetical protein
VRKNFHRIADYAASVRVRRLTHACIAPIA